LQDRTTIPPRGGRPRASEHIGDSTRSVDRAEGAKPPHDGRLTEAERRFIASMDAAFVALCRAHDDLLELIGRMEASAPGRTTGGTDPTADATVPVRTRRSRIRDVEPEP
jgi:hypothetical protein